MRINKYIAISTGLSRRNADQAIKNGRVKISGQQASLGDDADESKEISLDGQLVRPATTNTTLILNKPVGYVCSRKGQGSSTIYELLPNKFDNLKPVGRLDKDSSGLILMTNDGELAHSLTHPSFQKQKVYEVTLDKPLTEKDFKAITISGVDIGDKRPSKFQLQPMENAKIALRSSDLRPSTFNWQATLAEGRNRQIRRTFGALGYNVKHLRRTQFGPYMLNDLPEGTFAFTK